MRTFNKDDLANLHSPLKTSHKGQGGKLMIIGGSQLFHGASLWALKVASRIVDMVFYSSTAENNELSQKLKSELYDFISIPREKIDDYIQEADVVLIGPGMPREEGRVSGEDSTRDLTKKLLKKYSNKKWVIDAGAITEMDPQWLKLLNGNVIITPHLQEFSKLFNIKYQISKIKDSDQKSKTEDIAKEMADMFNCIILLKGYIDIICSSKECVRVEGGNVGMTKGGTGDVLAGLVAALACKNDLFLAAASASFINKKAGEELFKRVGPYFNASDLADEIPRMMNQLIIK